jgi:alkanesulfonate monooxygenase SsuD/methylene tetrahydromethanopterin reductase-like flavin-dependent oxidoreductase (luciferase family)
MTVEFGLSLPAGPPKGQVGRFRADLDASLPHLKGHFRSLWMTDHFIWGEKFTSYGDAPVYEAWTVMAYAAARWPDFEIGPMVLGQSYRNPALLAKMGATLQALCDGRFIMAVGAGWKEDEYHAYGFPFPSPGTRVAQLEDTLEIIKRMWTQPGPVSYQGQHYSIRDAYCEPRPDPLPPIIVGGGGYKTTRLAVRYADMWSMPDAPFGEYAKRLAYIEEHCEAEGRDPATLRRTWFGRLVVGRTEAEALARGVGKWTPKNAFVGTPAQVVEQMGPFVEAGVDYYMVEVLGLPDPDVIGMVTEEVIPQVRALA